MALSEPDGQLAYLRQNSYSDKVSVGENPGDLLKKIIAELHRSSEKTVTHYKKINEEVPIWAAIEILSFTTVSRMYSRWVNKDTVKKTIQGYKLFRDYKTARSIIRSMVYLRNLCAHQARIWNREMVVQVTNKNYLQPFGKSNERSVWRIISILMLLLDEINQNNNYSTDVLNLCKQNNDFYAGLVEPAL